MNTRAAWTALRVAVSAGAVTYLLHKAGIGSIGHRLADADPAWLGAGFAVAALSIACTILQWNRLLAATGVPVRFGRTVHLELAGDVFDAALPGAIGGDLIRATMSPETNEQRAPAAASVLLRRLCNFPGLVVVLAACLLACLHLPYLGRIEPFALGAMALGLAAVGIAFGPAAGWLARSRLTGRRIGRPVVKVATTLEAVRRQRSTMLWAGLRGTAFWCVVVASQWCFMRAVGVPVGLAYAGLVVTTTNTLTMLPISLGGYGVREGAFSAFLAAGGLASTSQGVAVGVCLTAQTMALGLAGVPFYLSLRRTRSRSLPAKPAVAVAA